MILLSGNWTWAALVQGGPLTLTPIDLQRPTVPLWKDMNLLYFKDFKCRFCFLKVIPFTLGFFSKGAISIFVNVFLFFLTIVSSKLLLKWSVNEAINLKILNEKALIDAQEKGWLPYLRSDFEKFQCPIFFSPFFMKFFIENSTSQIEIDLYLTIKRLVMYVARLHLA